MSTSGAGLGSAIPRREANADENSRDVAGLVGPCGVLSGPSTHKEQSVAYK